MGDVLKAQVLVKDKKATQIRHSSGSRLRQVRMLIPDHQHPVSDLPRASAVCFPYHLRATLHDSFPLHCATLGKTHVALRTGTESSTCVSSIAKTKQTSRHYLWIKEAENFPSQKSHLS